MDSVFEDKQNRYRCQVSVYRTIGPLVITFDRFRIILYCILLYCIVLCVYVCGFVNGVNSRQVKVYTLTNRHTL